MKKIRIKLKNGFNLIFPEPEEIIMVDNLNKTIKIKLVDKIGRRKLKKIGVI